jgi:hypothetical protein
MKKLCIFFLVLSAFSLSGFAQTPAQDGELPIDPDTKKITYKEVVQEKGTRDELYVRGIAWINSFYKNPADVTRTRDRDNGLIKGVARFKTYYTDPDGFKKEGPVIEYSLVFEFKEGRYRFSFTEMTRKETSRQPVEGWLNKKDPAYNPQWDDYLKQVNVFFTETITSLKKGMAPVVKKEDTW